MQKVYFGHPVNVYGTELEAKLERIIRRVFGGWEIVNPNSAEHYEGYKRYKEKTGRGMDYYFKEVLPYCSGGVFLPFRDGKWGAGIFGECEFLKKSGKPVWEMRHDGSISLVIVWENVVKRMLSIDETRARVYGPAGEKLIY